ncbi:polysaccharide deacetylase family protein [Bacillus sp. 1P06AnD]|uniref:polysaccharide deacetylase family protein n=1 Tax=Bacillus sp. 1P06AnD TaxID=3132208 RepID=UPI00399F8A6E
MKKWMGIVGLTIILIGACGIGKSMWEKMNIEVKMHSETTAFKEVNIETEIGRNKQFEYKVQTVATVNDDVNKQIQSYVDKQKTDFVKRMQANKEKAAGNHTYVLQAQLRHVSNKYISIEYIGQETKGSQKSKKSIQLMTYDLKNNKKVDLENLILRESAWNELAKQVKLRILQDGKAMKHTTTEQIMQGFSQPQKEFKNFSFTEKGMIVYVSTKDMDYPCFIPTERLKGAIAQEQLPPVYKVGVTNPEVLSNTVEGTGPENSTNQKVIALTFDDGPHKTRTPQVLDTLKKYNAKATFFVLGEMAKLQPELVKRAAAEGHEIGSHTWSHVFLPKLSYEDLLQQIYKTSEVITKTIGHPPTVLRPPYGAYNDQLKEALNVPIVNWNVDTLDWKIRNSQNIKRIVNQNAGSGSIVLMHDIQQATVEALDGILNTLKQQGYRFVTVSELLNIQGHQELVAGKVFNQKE